jgi:hypothetical protein
VLALTKIIIPSHGDCTSKISSYNYTTVSARAGVPGVIGLKGLSMAMAWDILTP